MSRRATSLTRRRRPELLDLQPTEERPGFYARLSGADDAEGNSIQGQLGLWRAHCARAGTTSVDEYVDEEQSGYYLDLHERPDGRRAIEDAASGRINVLYVPRLDRLGRTSLGILGAWKRLDKLGCTLRSLTEPIDTSTPQGLLFFQLLGNMAEFDRNMIVNKLSTARDRERRNGRHPGGPIPYGYVLDSERRYQPSTHPVGALDLTEAELVRELFERVAGGSTIVAEVARLNALGVPAVTRYPDGKERLARAWMYSRLHQMLHRTIYRGARVVSLSRDEIDLEAPALVDPATFAQIAARLTENARTAPRNTKHEYLLRGLIRCVNCGHKVSGVTRAGRQYYLCGRTISSEHNPKAQRCRTLSSRVDTLDAAVWADCREYLRDPERIIRNHQVTHRKLQAETPGLDAEASALRASQAEAERTKQRVLDLYELGRLSIEEIDERLARVEATLADIQGRLGAIRARQAVADATERQIISAVRLIREMGTDLEQIEAEHDLEKMHRLIAAVYVRIEMETVEANGERGVHCTVVRRVPTEDQGHGHIGNTTPQRNVPNMTATPAPLELIAALAVA